jgi:hypothetical protein
MQIPDLHLLEKCWHEAGHAVIGLKLGIRVFHVSAREDDMGGATRWDIRTATPESEAMMLMAGAATARRCYKGPDPDSWAAWVNVTSRDDEEKIAARIEMIEPAPARGERRRAALERKVDAMLGDAQTWKTVSTVCSVMLRDGYVGEDLLRRIYEDHLGKLPELKEDPPGGET